MSGAVPTDKTDNVINMSCCDVMQCQFTIQYEKSYLMYCDCLYTDFEKDDKLILTASHKPSNDLELL